MKAIFCLLFVVAVLAAAGQPAVSQELPPAPEGEAPPAGLFDEPAPQAPEAPLLEIVPAAPPAPPMRLKPPPPPPPDAPPIEEPTEELLPPGWPPEDLPPTDEVCIPSVQVEVRPEPRVRPLPAEADHPLYWAGLILYPVGRVLEFIIVRPLTAIFGQPFEDPGSDYYSQSSSAQLSRLPAQDEDTAPDPRRYFQPEYTE